MKPKSFNKILIIAVIAIGVYASFLLISDFNVIYNKITNFEIVYLPLILSLVSVSWLALFFRWTILLKKVNISIPLRSSFVIYLSSFSLSATPGQLGELIKSQLLKNKFNIPVAKTAPLIIIERLYDLTGAMFVSILGLWFLGIEIYIIIIAFSCLTVVFLLLRSRTAFNKILYLVKKIKFLSKFTESLSESYDTIHLSLNIKTLFLSIISSVTYWFVIGIAAYFVLKAVGIDTISIVNVVSIYSSSVIIGGLSFIPGGIGVTEGSIAGLLSLNGIDISIAFVLGILIRIFTLWYGVLIGFIALKFSGSLTNK